MREGHHLLVKRLLVLEQDERLIERIIEVIKGGSYLNMLITLDFALDVCACKCNIESFE